MEVAVGVFGVLYFLSVAVWQSVFERRFIAGWRSYGNSLEEVFQEDLIVNAILDDLFIVRQIDQHCEGILGDGGIILDQQLEIRDGLECVALE